VGGSPASERLRISRAIQAGQLSWAVKSQPVIVAPTVKLTVNVPKNTSVASLGAELSTIVSMICCASSSLSDLTANPLILLKWYYFLEAKSLSLFKGLKISMMPSPTGC
jgi:hypothetical protein